jgi:1,4-dihydroxy-2-naphthoate polyprenyltransferase
MDELRDTSSRKSIYETSLCREVEMLDRWLRAIRFKFLTATLIASAIGISYAYLTYSLFDLDFALLTLTGVFCLHASIDLLNDYWDYKRGIDKTNKRTRFSGGSGVIPENILSPSIVYKAAIVFLIIGITIGAYFAILKGPFIAFLLAFAVLSIIFYSSKIVNFGLAELFVAIKAALIVIGSYYIQTSDFGFPVVFIGAIIGLLSSSVLLINSFPDYTADRLGGRRTLVIMIGKRSSCRIFTAMVVTVYVMIMIGIIINILNVFSILCFASIPFAMRAINELCKHYEESEALVPAMASTINYSRITSLALLFSFIFPMI